MVNRESICARISNPPLRAHYTLFISDAIEAEVVDVLTRPRVRAKFPQITDKRVAESLHILRAESQHIDVKVVELISRDPKDDIFLACAKAAKADYLVSEDNDLLVLKTYSGVTIISALDFLTILQSR